MVASDTIASRYHFTGAQAFMLKQIEAQLRIIGVVAMREISSQQPSLIYGYLWAVIDAMLSVLGLLLMKLVLRGSAMPGVPPATYILTGALPWFMFLHLVTAADPAIVKHRRLLSIPIVTELDVVIGSSLQVVVTYMIVMALTVTVSSVLERVGLPHHPLGVLLLLIAAWLMGTFLGLVLLPLNRIYPPATKFLSFVLRFALFLSSVFIPLSRFPSYVWPYLTWNPMLHVEELLRQYWFVSYISPVGNPMVVIQWTVIVVTLGLMCERYARRRIPLQ